LGQFEGEVNYKTPHFHAFHAFLAGFILKNAHGGETFKRVWG
jgi:hypothetical protein